MNESRLKSNTEKKRHDCTSGFLFQSVYSVVRINIDAIDEWSSIVSSSYRHTSIHPSIVINVVYVNKHHRKEGSPRLHSR